MLSLTVKQKPTARTVRADTQTGRFYHIPDPVTGDVVQFPSVTTILSAINKPALVPWAAKEERLAVSEAAADLYQELIGQPQLPRSMYQLALEQRLGKTKAHVKALAKAAEIGTQTHSMIEWTLRQALGLHVGPEPALVEQAQWGFMAWQDFAKEIALAPQFIEQTVYSRTHVFAGTLDLVATMNAKALLRRLSAQAPVEANLAAWLEERETVTACLDFKTSKGIYPESFLQNVAYQRALAEMGHGRVDGGLIVRLPKVTSDPGFEIGIVPPARDLFPTFLAARQLWQWQYEQEQAFKKRRIA